MVFKKCGTCGKLFIYRSLSIYKIPGNATRGSTEVYCSYTCYTAGKEKYHYKTRVPGVSKLNEGY